MQPVHKVRADLPPRIPHACPQMASFQKTDSGVRVQVDVKGRRSSKTLPTMREAREWARDKELELSKAAGGNQGHGKTLLEALRKFADEEAPKRRGSRSELVRLKSYEGDHHGLPLSLPLALVTDDHLRAWRDRRLKLVDRGTVLRDMTQVSAVLEHARTEWKWIKHNPMRDVKKPSQPAHRERVITGPEIRKTLRALGYSRGPIRTVSQSVAVCFLLALCTGMRVKELSSLRWVDVRTAHGTARNVKAVELGVSRDIPFSPVARRLVDRMEGWDKDTVFGVSPATLSALFLRARKKAGLEGFTFHDSRHTAATKIARKLHILDLCKMFGWKKTDQALTYYNPTAAQIASRL